MAVSRTEEIQRKKQAIHLAMCTVLTEEEAQGAVHSWVQHVSTSASMFNGLHVFARKVCMTYGKDSRHVELAQAMSRALMGGSVEQASNDALPVPAAIEAASGEAPVLLLGAENRTPEFASFQLLLRAYLHKVDERDAALGGLCREFLLNVVDNLPWSPEQQKQVVNLINNGASRQIRPYRPEQLKTLMRHLTVWMQDMVGDEISKGFSVHAISVVEHNEVGVSYSPREFFSRV